MKQRTRPTTVSQHAFTLVELLTVIAIIAILAALIMPVFAKATAKAKRIQCVSNLRQSGIGFHVFMHDHDSKFPMQVSTNDGGTLEFIYASYSMPSKFYFQYHHFQALSNEMERVGLLVCPTDKDRFSAQSFPLLTDLNVSYFIGANADFSQPNSILAGDRNVTNSTEGDVTILRLNGDTYAHWTSELHVYRGNVLYADGRVEQLDSTELKLAKYNAPGILDLILPSVNKPATNGQPTPASAAHHDPPPGFPPMPPHRHTQVIALQSSSSPNSAPARNPAPAPPGNSTTSQTVVNIINPPSVVNPPTAPPPPLIPAPLKPARRTNQIAETPPEPPPIIIAEAPEKAIVPGHHWLWWLLLLLALLIGIEIGRRMNRKPQQTPINRK